MRRTEAPASTPSCPPLTPRNKTPSRYGVLRFAELPARVFAPSDGAAERADVLADPHAEHTVRLVRVHNPWGAGAEWEGAYGDHDPVWRSASAEVKAKLGFCDRDDGSWFMRFDDWLRVFNIFDVARRMPAAEWDCWHVRGQWKGLSAGGERNIHLNPQFHLSVDVDCEIVIEVRQPLDGACASLFPCDVLRSTEHHK